MLPALSHPHRSHRQHTPPGRTEGHTYLLAKRGAHAPLTSRTHTHLLTRNTPRSFGPPTPTRRLDRRAAPRASPRNRRAPSWPRTPPERGYNILRTLTVAHPNPVL